ncbi:MAG: mismatch repair protein MutS [Candidatus Dependentiae bacterium]|nr:mismatch repair protein MutS [Candidatus Dependentiae bacterium]
MSAQQTPLMAQYHGIKAHYPDALLFFQVGDFYELFFDDAVRASRYLAITLTKRGKANGMDIPLCGVPVHALHFYLTKLVKGGFSVALCDQRSKPQPGTVVERAVTKVYTPGTLTDDAMLNEKVASYVCSVVAVKGQCDIVAVELLTAHQVRTSVPEYDMRSLEAELARYMPDEVLLCNASPLASTIKKWGYVVTMVHGESSDALQLMHQYLARVQPAIIEQLSAPVVYEPTQYVMLDAATQRNIALIHNHDNGGDLHTVCHAIDGTVTAMGARLLKKWLVRPLRDQRLIEQRHDVVALFAGDVTVRSQVQQIFTAIADVERIVGRMVLMRATIADYRALRDSLASIAQLHALLSTMPQTELLGQLLSRCGSYEDLQGVLVSSIYDGEQEWFIKPGYSEKLDSARALSHDGHAHIQRYAAEQASSCDISSLKILYTSVSGYFIEVTKTHTHKVPESYRHIQTLAGRERYVTAELSALEQALQSAHEDAVVLDKELYSAVETYVRSFAGSLRRTAAALATLDVLCGFAQIAATHRYARPTFTADRVISIAAGRHPVVEQALEAGHFVANDTMLDVTQRVWLVTGPNMGGKSTYLRQVALIVLLAQCGSFVPARRAELMLVDRIFTRIGAGDNVAQGKSTFLVEMEEAATICMQATSASLVILDEVGRGTSTEDGRALAQAIIEHLVSQIGCLTLFATHYHELTALAEEQPSIANYHMVCYKQGDTLHFLHRIEPGIATASFGVDVAHLAQLPPSIIARARQLLAGQSVYMPARIAELPILQKVLPEHPVCAELRALDIDALSPRAAFELIYRLKSQLKEDTEA